MGTRLRTSNGVRPFENEQQFSPDSIAVSPMHQPILTRLRLSICRLKLIYRVTFQLALTQLSHHHRTLEVFQDRPFPLFHLQTIYIPDLASY